MEVRQTQSKQLIDGLAQAMPFRFIDQVCELDDTRVATELHTLGMPQRFVNVLEAIELYTVLEFAAQSCGLLLRDRKKDGERGVLASFQGVQVKNGGALSLPLRLQAQLVDERWTLFEFDFQVYARDALAVLGRVAIVIRGQHGTY